MVDRHLPERRSHPQASSQYSAHVMELQASSVGDLVGGAVGGLDVGAAVGRPVGDPVQAPNRSVRS